MSVGNRADLPTPPDAARLEALWSGEFGDAYTERNEAAGEGRRLRPITDRWPKPLLPIDGRPVLAVLLRELARTGLGRVTVVVGHLADQVMALAGDGSAFGLELRYARQPDVLGSADAVRRAMVAGA